MCTVWISPLLRPWLQTLIWWLVSYKAPSKVRAPGNSSKCLNRKCLTNTHIVTQHPVWGRPQAGDWFTEEHRLLIISFFLLLSCTVLHCAGPAVTLCTVALLMLGFFSLMSFLGGLFIFYFRKITSCLTGTCKWHYRGSVVLINFSLDWTTGLWCG